MRTYPITATDGVMFAVEVDNVYIRPGSLAKLLSEIDGVTHMRTRGQFKALDDEHANFSYHGIEFMIWEPYGDSSRYWIGPIEPEKGRIDIIPIERRLKEYRPSLIVSAIGNLLMLRFASLFKR